MLDSMTIVCPTLCGTQIFPPDQPLHKVETTKSDASKPLNLRRKTLVGEEAAEIGAVGVK